MKGKLATLVVVIAVIGAIIGLNSVEPQRRTQLQLEERMKAEYELEEIRKAEAKAASREANAKLFEDTLASGRERAEELKSLKGDFTAKFECSNGDFVIEVDSVLAPIGALRFKEAIKAGVYDGARFFRVVPGFVAQFGIPGDPEMSAVWSQKKIKDDPVVASNTRGTISFATSGPNSRTTQVFINFGDNANLDAMGFAPFGRVTEGMDVVDSIYSKDGQNPDQGAIQRKGNEYLESAYPNLDYIKKVTIIEEHIPGAEDTPDVVPEPVEDADEEALEDAA